MEGDLCHGLYRIKMFSWGRGGVVPREHGDCGRKAFVRGPASMGRRRPAVPSPEPLKGRLWQTNGSQDGSHETRRVFQVVASEGGV